jgi:hypothetical protein
MIALIAILVGFGCGYIGWDIGLALYAAVFESLRHYDLDAVIDSRATLDLIRVTFAAVGFLVGLWLAWRWRLRDVPAAGGETSRIFAIGALAGTGGAVMAHMADVGGLFIQVFGVGKDAYILIMLAASFLMLVLGVALAVGFYGGWRPKRAFAGRTAAAFAGALGLIFCGLAVNKALSPPYGRSWPPVVWVEIRFPASVTVPPAKETAEVELRTDQGREEGHPSEWLREGDRLVLRASVDLAARTRQRVVVLSLPGEPERHFRMRFPSNPKPSHGYGRWRRIDGIAPAGQALQPPAGSDGDFAIRYMIL